MRKALKYVVFFCCLVSLLVSMQIFYNQGIAADELGISASLLFGGELWLYMVWLRLLLLFGATVFSFICLFPGKKVS